MAPVSTSKPPSISDEKRAVGRRVREARESLGLSQRRVAALIDCDMQYLSALERGCYNLTPAMRSKLARVFGHLDPEFFPPPEAERPSRENAKAVIRHDRAARGSRAHES